MALLASLAAAGVVERAGRGRFLRITPRFLAHAASVAARRHVAVHDPVEATAHALATWDGYLQDPGQGARLLHEVLGDQLGCLRPLFPSLEAFPAAA